MINMFDFESQMVRIIPSFAGFTEFTTSVPKIYWDVKSQEQRIHGICKLLNKCICYADMLGENVNEIAQTLKDIEDGKLDDLIVEAIAQWFEENEPQIVQDIEDLQRRVGDLETATEGLAGDIETETLNRENADAILLDYSSLHNQELAFDKPAKFYNDKTDMFVESATDITIEDVAKFRYAGKTIDEIFDPDALWSLFIMGDIQGAFPQINGVTPQVNNNCYYNDADDTLEFNSWELFEETGAYLRWQNVPVVASHTYAIFECSEFNHYKRGEFGFEDIQIAFGVGVEGIKQIIGHNVTATNSTMNIIVGNLPRNTGLFIWERPKMYTTMHNMVVIDLDLLFENGQQDDYAGFANAYYMYMVSKNLQASKYQTQFVTKKTADLSDIEAYNAFIGKMNDYAHDMNMSGTVYNSASGYPSYPGATAPDSELNTFTCPVDSLKILLACSNVPFLKNTLASRYHNVALSQGYWNTDMAVPNNIVDSSQALNYMRIYGKAGQLGNTLTGAYAPYGVVNMAAACVLPNGHTGYIAVLNTPYNSGSGLQTNVILSYYQWIQSALAQIIAGTDPSSVNYNADLLAAMQYSAQPTSFAAFIAPEGYDNASFIAMDHARIATWFAEAKCYLGNNDGTGVSDTQVVAASVSKLMTAYIAAMECDLNELVELHATDYIGGSGMIQLQSADFASNAVMTVRDAITAMMYYSDNTIATALARHVGYKIAGNAYNGTGIVKLG